MPKFASRNAKWARTTEMVEVGNSSADLGDLFDYEEVMDTE